MDYTNQPGIEFLPANEETRHNLPVLDSDMPMKQLIGREQLQQFTAELQKYKAGKARTEARIIGAEQWWKLHNEQQEVLDGAAQWQGFRSASSWLHNVIINKHADAMDSFPTPTILPREMMDEQEAKTLSSVIPCVMEQNHFEDVYADVMWQKLKTGTGCYKVIWDKDKLNGLGDISIQKANILNLFWEPGVVDIQKSRYFFDTELVDQDVLEEHYAQVKGKTTSMTFQASKFLYDDSVSLDGKVTVIGVYYHKDGVLHYCKYVNDIVLESTENAGMQEGLYDHGLYPFVFDPLYPIEGSPCGYGYVDVCRNPQTEIDLMRTAVVQNAMAGATPRHFVRADGSINEEEYLDITKPIVHVNGNLGEDSIRPIPHISLEGNYINFLQETISELRETSGNTEAATGAGNQGATAASAIAALQEASGKTSRDATRAAYRAYNKLVEFCIELIRQFYDVPRTFRITGDMGEQQFVQYSNSGIRPQDQGNDFGMDMGYRLPVFDIKVDAQKKSAYSTLSQNELAIQFFQLGFFNPQAADSALACIEMMEFTGKDKLRQRIQQNGTLLQQNQMLIQYAAQLAMQSGNAQAMQQLAMMQQQMQGGMPAMGMGKLAELNQDAGHPEEASHMQKARQRVAESTQPE